MSCILLPLVYIYISPSLFSIYIKGGCSYFSGFIFTICQLFFSHRIPMGIEEVVALPLYAESLL